jgi:hypothetical protein
MASRCFFPREAEAGGRHHHHQSKAAAEALEQLHHGGRVLSREDVGGAVRVKIVVSKRELKHMVAALGSGTGRPPRGPPPPRARDLLRLGIGRGATLVPFSDLLRRRGLLLQAVLHGA